MISTISTRDHCAAVAKTISSKDGILEHIEAFASLCRTQRPIKKAVLSNGVEEDATEGAVWCDKIENNEHKN